MKSLCSFCASVLVLEVACWIVTCERHAAWIRNLYLKTILKQEIAFFDKETNTGEVVGRMSGDTVLIQDAMGEKVTNYFPSFFRSWFISCLSILLFVIGLLRKCDTSTDLFSIREYICYLLTK